MYHEHFIKHENHLRSIATLVDYTLEIRHEEGDSCCSVFLNAPDKSSPDLSVDYLSKDARFSFRAMLPHDRWGYPQRNGYGSSAHEATVSVTNNAAKAAGYVNRLIKGAMEDHGKHLTTIKSMEDYYDRQMGNLENLALLIEHLKPRVHGLNAKPNHNGAVSTSIDFPDNYDLSIEVSGSGVTIKATSLEPYRAAKMIHAYFQK